MEQTECRQGEKNSTTLSDSQASDSRRDVHFTWKSSASTLLCPVPKHVTKITNPLVKKKNVLIILVTKLTPRVEIKTARAPLPGRKCLTFILIFAQEARFSLQPLWTKAPQSGKKHSHRDTSARCAALRHDFPGPSRPPSGAAHVSVS